MSALAYTLPTQLTSLLLAALASAENGRSHQPVRAVSANPIAAENGGT